MYIVVEFQSNAGQTSILTYPFTVASLADQKYHEVLAYAAISEVEIHAVSIMNEYGCVAKNEFYTHFPEVVIDNEDESEVIIDNEPDVIIDNEPDEVDAFAQDSSSEPKE